MGLETCRELEEMVFIPDEEVDWEVTWLELTGGDVEAFKFDCWSRDTRWMYCSWVIPALEEEEEASTTIFIGLTLEASWEEALTEDLGLMKGGNPCFW